MAVLGILVDGKQEGYWGHYDQEGEGQPLGSFCRTLGNSYLFSYDRVVHSYHIYAIG